MAGRENGRYWSSNPTESSSGLTRKIVNSADAQPIYFQHSGTGTIAKSTSGDNYCHYVWRGPTIEGAAQCIAGAVSSPTGTVSVQIEEDDLAYMLYTSSTVTTTVTTFNDIGQSAASDVAPRAEYRVSESSTSIASFHLEFSNLSTTADDTGDQSVSGGKVIEGAKILFTFRGV